MKLILLPGINSKAKLTGMLQLQTEIKVWLQAKILIFLRYTIKFTQKTNVPLLHQL